MQISNSGTLIVALIAIGVVSTAFVLIKTKGNPTQANKPQQNPQEESKMEHPTDMPFDPNNLPESDKKRYGRATSTINQAIEAKDWDYLEDQLNTTTQDFPDLIAKINEVLKNKPQDQK